MKFVRLEYQAAKALVAVIFEDDVKAALWMDTENPLLGNIAPATMIRMGNFEKLLQFINNAIEEGGFFERRDKKCMEIKSDPSQD